MTNFPDEFEPDDESIADKPDDGSEDSEALDSQLLDLAEDYLDDELSEDDAQAFEARLPTDPELQEALVQSLMFKGMLDLCFQKKRSELPASSAGGDCQSVRILVPKYSSGEIPPTQTAFLSKHLERCGTCQAYYTEYRSEESRPKRRRRWAVSVPLVFTIVIIGGIALSSQWLSSPDSSSKAPTAAHAIRTMRAGLELPFGERSQLATFTLQFHEKYIAGDPEVIATAISALEEMDPNYLLAVAKNPLINQWLPDDPTKRKELTFLLGMFHEVRLPPDERWPLLELAVTRLQDPREFLWSIFSSSDAESVIHAAVQLLRERGFHETETESLRDLFHWAVSVGSGRCVHIALEGLVQTSDARAREYILGVLRGEYQVFRDTRAPNFATLLWRLDTALFGVEPKEALEEIATSSRWSVARAHAAEALWLKSKDLKWRLVMAALADDANIQTQSIVAGCLARSPLETDREVLQKLANSQTPIVAKYARDGLDRLNSAK